jgi:hypothetical protein
MAKVGSKLINDISKKINDGEFLPEVINKNPHLARKADHLLRSYCDLIIDLAEIFKSYKGSKNERARIREWIRRFRQSRKLEHDLFHHSYFVEIGGE